MTWIRSLGAGSFAPAEQLGPAGAGYLLLEPGQTNRRWAYCTTNGLHDLRETEDGLEDTLIGGPICTRIIRADWNRDGIDDLITSREVIALYEGHEDGSLSFTEITLLSGDTTPELGYFDINGDGLEDIVAINARDSVVMLLATP